MDEGKLRKISGRLFSDSGPRRSTRLAGEAGGNTNSTSTASTGNGTSHSTKYTGSSKLSNAGLRSVTIRRGQGWASESFDEGIRHSAFDDSRLLAHASVTPTSLCDARSVDQDTGAVCLSRTAYDDSRIHNGAKEILVLLRLLGEGYRLSCTYKCQVVIHLWCLSVLLDVPASACDCVFVWLHRMHWTSTKNFLPSITTLVGYFLR